MAALAAAMLVAAVLWLLLAMGSVCDVRVDRRVSAVRELTPETADRRVSAVRELTPETAEEVRLKGAAAASGAASGAEEALLLLL